MVNEDGQINPSTRSTQSHKDASRKFAGVDSDQKRPMSATIQKPKSEVFALLSNIKNFPHFLENLEEVDAGDQGKTTWHFRDSVMGGDKLSIPMQLEGESGAQELTWKASDKAGFGYSIAIRLEDAQAGRGTVVRMQVQYDSLAGKLAGMFEKIFGNDAEILTKKNLQRFKAFCETGHVPTIVGQPSGRDEDTSTTTKH